MTKGELVSRVVNAIRALNKDEHISRRFILQTAQNKATFLISQKLRDRSLYKEDSLFRTISCFELESDDIIKCDVVEFRRCNSVMKSKEKLPKMFYSRYGNSIISVTSIDDGKQFLPITMRSYINSKNRMYSKYIKSRYYYVKDGYLYIPDSEVEAVNVVLIPINEEEVDKKSGCNNKKQDRGDGCCKSAWDYEFICPDKLTEAVIQDTLQEVLKTFRSIAIDENPNMSSNQKDRVIQ